MSPTSVPNKPHPRPDPALSSDRPAKRAPPDPATTLEVDIMILDHTAHQCISASLSSSLTLTPALPDALRASDACWRAFRTRHPTYRPDAELRLRVLLLRIVALVAHRYTRNATTPAADAVAALRARNQHRARAWIAAPERLPSARLRTATRGEDGATDGLPLAAEERLAHRDAVLRGFDGPAGQEDDDEFYGTPDSLALLDLLPLFMQVSAASMDMNDSRLSAPWIRLACDFTRQACLEQYLVFGADGLDAIDEAFAWGYCPRRDSPDPDAHDPDAIAAMFEADSPGRETRAWTTARDATLASLDPPDGPAPAAAAFPLHLAALARAHPLARFDAALRSFLADLAQSIPLPVLAQLDRGWLDGMTAGETRAFLCGCGLASFLDLDPDADAGED